MTDSEKILESHDDPPASDSVNTKRSDLTGALTTWTNIVPVFQNKGSGKTTLLVQLAKHKMLGAMFDLNCSHYTDAWHPFLTLPYGRTKEPSASQCACFFACHLAAVSIQLTRLARKLLKEFQLQHATHEFTLQDWLDHIVRPISQNIFEDENTNEDWQQTVLHQTKALYETGNPFDQDKLLELMQNWRKRRGTPITLIHQFSENHPTWHTETSKDTFDAIEIFASKLGRFFSQDVSELDSLPAFLTSILGSENIQKRPLFFYALKGHDRLTEPAKETLLRVWQHFQRPSLWMILVGHGTQHREKIINTWSSDYESQMKRRESQPFFSGYPLFMHDAFEDLPYDAAWEDSPPSSSAQTVAQLRGMTFAALECVALRYGRPMWMAEKFISLDKPRFGPVSLLRVYKDVLHLTDLGAGKEGGKRYLIELLFSLRVPYFEDYNLNHRYHSYKCKKATFGTRKIKRLTRNVQHDAAQEELSIVETEGLDEPVCSALAAYIFRAQTKMHWSYAADSFTAFCFNGDKDDGPVNCFGRLATTIFLAASDIAHNLLGTDPPLSYGFETPVEDLLERQIKGHRRTIGLFGTDPPLSYGFETPVQNLLERQINDPIPFWRLIDVLLNRNVDSDGRGSFSEPEEPTLLWMKTRLTNFTHILKMPQAWKPGEPLPLGTLVDGWIRQCAWMAEDSEREKWSLVIPVHRAGVKYVHSEFDKINGEELALHPFEPDWLEYVIVRVRPPRTDLDKDHQDCTNLQEVQKETRPADSMQASDDPHTLPSLNNEHPDQQRDLPPSAEKLHAADDASTEAVLTWSRVEEHRTVAATNKDRGDAEGQSKIGYRSHMVVSIDFTSRGSARWLNRVIDPPEKDTNQTRMTDIEQDDVSKSDRLERHDLWLSGNGDKKSFLDDNQCALFGTIHPKYMKRIVKIATTMETAK
nr:uncharacterized protein BN887_01867 [Melanopsichium pennsylvanicum 4]